MGWLIAYWPDLHCIVLLIAKMPSSLISESTNFLPQTFPWRRRTWFAALTALSLITLLVQGYHPLAEDGGLYVAGVEYTLNPTLFPQDTTFVTEHLRFSVFAPALASLVRATHLSLEQVLLLTYVFSLALTLWSARKLLQRCVRGDAAQLAGVTLIAVWGTIPVAGTSLLMLDPYLTARSISTPLSLLAVAYALDSWKSWRSLFACGCCLLIAALFHPLMAAYALAFVLVIRLTQTRRRILAWTLLTAAAISIAALLQLLAPHESPSVVAAAISRYYWFLSQWQWFELLGLVGPLLVLAALLHWRRHSLTPAAATLLRASLAIGSIATLIAMLFAHENYATHLIARLQPLRVFLVLYAVMTALLGATAAQLAIRLRHSVSSRSARLAVSASSFALLIFLAATMFQVQRMTFPASPHIELPGQAMRHSNPWVQAFLWAQRNTPQKALFVLDAKYVNEDGEDAQTFRAWSERSAVPDFSKDGGEAAITPALAQAWQQGATAQKGLSQEQDELRDATLLPLGVTWMVLHVNAQTKHPCPYRNATVKVCQLIR
jgi:hypothetical protein